jgi:hypothetical protein
MADLISGNLGSAGVSASAWCAITQWNLTLDQSILEKVTHCSAPWTITARGNKKITGTITAAVDDDARLESTWITDSLIPLELVTNGSNKWAGNARLGAINTASNIETAAIQEITVSFTSDGAWTFSYSRIVRKQKGSVACKV